MYEDYGNKTCAGYPGVLNHEKVDIDTFVEWEIDYLKLDGCYIDPEKMDEGENLEKLEGKVFLAVHVPLRQSPLLKDWKFRSL